MGNQTKLVEIDARLEVIETKTTLMPPADYRAYMEAKFNETNRRIEDLADALRDHAIRNGQ